MSENDSNNENENSENNEENLNSNSITSNLYKQSKVKFSNDKESKREITKSSDPHDDSYDSEKDPVSVIIFDSEINFLTDIEYVDIVFVLDTTNSMSPFFKGIKRFIRKLINDAKKTLSHYKNTNVDMLKIGIVGYKDHINTNSSYISSKKSEENYVSKILCDLTGNHNEFKDSLFQIKCNGGGDDAEAVLDGLNLATNGIKWRESSLKYIYHICDMPPHGSELNGNVNDDYKNGCPCGLKHKEILEEIRCKYIEYTVIMLDACLENMIEAFSKYSKIDVMQPNIKKDKNISGKQ
jgi:hypothetical protein